MTQNSSSGDIPLAYGNLMIMSADWGNPSSILANVFPPSGDAATGLAWQVRPR